MNILISAAGRRVGLIGCFRESFRRLAIAGSILAADASSQAPALHFADQCCRTPRCGDPAFLPRLMEIAARERIDLIVPTIDPELPVYARARPLLEARGTAVVASAPEAIAICADKHQTHHWLKRQGFPVPEQQDLAAALAPHAAANGRRRDTAMSFPRIVKPRRGSGSVGVRPVGSLGELRAVASLAENEGRLGDYVVEEIAAGDEHTINVFVDKLGVCRCAVPHRRVEVRGGEVSKATTVRHAGMMDLARRIAETLPGARGPLSIQCFLADDGSVRVTEINPRFGGGYPLTHRAGARFTDWLLEEWLDVPCTASGEWTGNLTMLRYDRELFLSADSEAPLLDTLPKREAVVVA